jgi:hypothetical protein
MTITIDFPRDVERALKDQAGSKGQSMPEYVVALLTEAAGIRPELNSAAKPVDVATRLAALERIGSYRTRAGLPVLSDDAVDVTYRAREDSQL